MEAYTVKDHACKFVELGAWKLKKTATRKGGLAGSAIFEVVNPTTLVTTYHSPIYLESGDTFEIHTNSELERPTGFVVRNYGISSSRPDHYKGMAFSTLREFHVSGLK